VALEGETPGEQPALGVLNTRQSPGTLERVKAQEPRLAKPAPAPRVRGYTGERNGRWVQPDGKRPVTSCEEKAPKGESHERCRYETRPARYRKGVNRQEGSQTLKAERGGQVNARGKRTFDSLKRCREPKPMRGADRLRRIG